MRKKDTTTKLRLLRFPDRKQRRIREITRNIETIYDPIPTERARALLEVMRQRLGTDYVSVEALAALLCAIADPTGDPEKFETARVVLRDLCLFNDDYGRVDSVFFQMWT